MSPAEAATLLGMAAAFDNRKPDEDTAKAWAAALDGLPFDDCRLALIEHYKSSETYLMPVMIRRRVLQMRSSRIKADDINELIPKADPDDVQAYLAELREIHARVGCGAEVERPALPPSKPRDLRALVAPMRRPD